MPGQHKSATQIVLETMEEFSRSEPRQIVILFTNEDDQLVIKTNTSRAGAVGMLECAKRMVLDT